VALAGQDGDPTVRIDGEDAVGLQVEIAGAVTAVEGAALAALLDIEADGFANAVIHAGIHREAEGLAALAQMLAKRGQAAERLAAGIEHQLDPVFTAAIAAGGEAGPFERDELTRAGAGAQQVVG
jgi:hypothetical protein